MKLCPRCDAASKVYGQDADGDGIVRYRRCQNPDCGHKFKTFQTPEQVIVEDNLQRAEKVAGP